MYFWDVIDESKIGKRYRNSWNGKLYQVIKTENGCALDICEIPENSDLIITQIEIIE